MQKLRALICCNDPEVLDPPYVPEAPYVPKKSDRPK
jgi:hypothetical protein